MYEIIIESSEFQGVSRVKQHQLVTDALKEQIKEIHGIRIQTIVPKIVKHNCRQSQIIVRNLIN